MVKIKLERVAHEKKLQKLKKYFSLPFIENLKKLNKLKYDNNIFRR
jgi:hypothetical protein